MPSTSYAYEGLTFPDGTLLSTSSSVGLHNKLINGGMKVDQRNSGVAQTITAAAALAYTVDRWYAYCTGANVTGQRIAGSGSTLNRYQLTGAAATTKIGFAQRIEQANSFDLAGGPATIAVDLSNSLLTTVTWVASYANTADIFGSLASPTVTQFATGTFTVTSVLARYSIGISIPVAATTGLQIEFSVGAQVSGTWVVGNAQLEPGTVATPLSQRPVGFELMLCQRYLPKFNANAAHFAQGFAGVSSVNTTSNFILPYKVTPRVPATGIVNTAAANYSIITSVGGVVVSAMGFVNSSFECLVVNVNHAAQTAGSGLFLYGGATDYIYGTGCEL